MPMCLLKLMITLVAALEIFPAFAQTANSGPNDPSLARLPGTPPNVTRTAPSEGRLRGRSQVPPPKIVTETDQEFRQEQKRMEKDMTICRGC